MRRQYSLVRLALAVLLCTAAWSFADTSYPSVVAGLRDCACVAALVCQRHALQRLGCAKLPAGQPSASSKILPPRPRPTSTIIWPASAAPGRSSAPGGKLYGEFAQQSFPGQPRADQGRGRPNLRPPRRRGLQCQRRPHRQLRFFRQLDRLSLPLARAAVHRQRYGLQRLGQPKLQTRQSGPVENAFFVRPSATSPPRPT